MVIELESKESTLFIWSFVSLCYSRAVVLLLAIYKLSIIGCCFVAEASDRMSLGGRGFNYYGHLAKPESTLTLGTGRSLTCSILASHPSQTRTAGIRLQTFHAKTFRARPGIEPATFGLIDGCLTIKAIDGGFLWIIYYLHIYFRSLLTKFEVYFNYVNFRKLIFNIKTNV